MCLCVVFDHYVFVCLFSDSLFKIVFFFRTRRDGDWVRIAASDPSRRVPHPPVEQEDDEHQFIRHGRRAGIGQESRRDGPREIHRHLLVSPGLRAPRWLLHDHLHGARLVGASLQRAPVPPRRRRSRRSHLGRHLLLQQQPLQRQILSGCVFTSWVPFLFFSFFDGRPRTGGDAVAPFEEKKKTLNIYLGIYAICFCFFFVLALCLVCNLGACLFVNGFDPSFR